MILKTTQFGLIKPGASLKLALFGNILLQS